MDVSQPQGPIEPSNSNGSATKFILLGASLGIGFVVALGIGWYVLDEMNVFGNEGESVEDIQGNDPQISRGEFIPPPPERQEFIDETGEVPAKEFYDFTYMLEGQELQMEMYDRAKVLSDKEQGDILRAVNATHSEDYASMQGLFEDYDPLYVYEVGTLTGPSVVDGYTLYRFFYPIEGMGIHLVDALVFYTPKSQGFISIGELPAYSWYPRETHNYFSGYITHEVSSPHKNVQRIAVPGGSAYLESRGALRSSESNMFYNYGATDNANGILDARTADINAPYEDSLIEFTDPTYGPVYFIDNEYRIVFDDGSVHTFELKPGFFVDDEGEPKNLYGADQRVNILWNDDYNGSDTYQVAGMGGQSGCSIGILRQTNIVNDLDWFDPSRLVQVGTTNVGPVYDFEEDLDNELYRSAFRYGFSGYTYFQDQDPEAYEKFNQLSEDEQYKLFIQDDPIMYWKDHMGRWRIYLKGEYRSLAECGKPVIYLYPEEATDVNVKVVPNGGFTYTDPLYPVGGWDVKADPNGTLYNYADGKTYPYLFWEGHADGFGYSDKGFVLNRDTLNEELSALLLKAGLNDQETKDFVEFWEPYMSEEPYVFVTFANQYAFEQAAPLSVTPRPDSVLRIFMYFEPLAEPRDVEPLPLNGFERRGFTVVEWGGVLEKK